MSKAEVARRYAESLIEAAEDHDKVAPLRELMAKLSGALSESEALSSVLLNPRVRDEEKMRVLGRLLESDEPLLSSFLSLVFRHRRSEDLAAMASDYVTLADAKLGLADAVVESVVPLTDGEREKLMHALKERFSKEIRLIEKENKALIGGLRVRVQGEVMDRSVLGSLSQIRMRLEVARSAKEGTA